MNRTPICKTQAYIKHKPGNPTLKTGSESTHSTSKEPLSLIKLLMESKTEKKKVAVFFYIRFL